jgi:hypothetical protein
MASLAAFETLVLLLIVASVFIYTFVVVRHRTDTSHHTDAMAGGEGDE